MVHRNASLHKYARPTTRSTNLFGTVSWFCMVAPLMSKLWDATVAEVAPLSNPTLSGKKTLGMPKRIITHTFLGAGTTNGTRCSPFPTWNRFEYGINNVRPG